MSRCAIMQPTVFPWAGYFNLMAQVDHFVFLDDVQLDTRSWQTRNKILQRGAAHWISVPIRHIAQRQTINETEVANPAAWLKKTSQTIGQSYAKHRHAQDIAELLHALAAAPTHRLSQLNQSMIEFIAEKLQITTERMQSSELGVVGQRSQRLIRICEAVGADTYVSPKGSADYLAEDEFSHNTPIALVFHEFQPRPYEQRGADAFISHLSIIDVIANLGWAGAANYIRGA